MNAEEGDAFMQAHRRMPIGAIAGSLIGQRIVGRTG
jgi:hypothetical protein